MKTLFNAFAGDASRPILTRRQALTGALTAALAVTALPRVKADEAPAAFAGNDTHFDEGRFERPTPIENGLARCMHTATALLDGRLLLVGGYHRRALQNGEITDAPLSNVQIYDPAEETWYDAAPLQQARARHAALLLPDGRVLVLGGLYIRPTASAEIYTPWNNTWHDTTPLQLACFDHAASFVNGQVMVTGGVHQTPLSRVEIYLP